MTSPGAPRGIRGAVSEPTCVVPRGGAFDGLVLLDGPARIEGEVNGAVVASGPATLWIGEHARVSPLVEAEEVVVAGVVEGRIRARGRVELLATARVHAVVESPRLALAEGSVFQGRCVTGDELPADREAVGEDPPSA